MHFKWYDLISRSSQLKTNPISTVQPNLPVMEFILGKELRTLAVVEFVILILGRSQVRCENYEEVDGIYQNTFDDTLLRRIVKAVRTAFQFLQFAIYRSILVILQKDLQQCNDPTSFVPIYLGFVVIAFNVFFWVMSFEYFSKYFGPDGGLKGAIISAVLPTLIRFKNSRKPLNIHERLAAIENHALNNGFQFVKSILRTYFLIFVTIMLCSIALGAVSFFFFLTSIKLAIPEDYEAMCESDDLFIRNIMLAIQIIVIIHFLNRALALVFDRIKCLRDSAMLPFLQLFVEAFFQISTTILSIILSIRSTKIWRGEELSIYETIVMSVSLPTIYGLLWWNRENFLAATSSIYYSNDVMAHVSGVFEMQELGATMPLWQQVLPKY